MIFLRNHLASTVLMGLALAVHWGWWRSAAAARNRFIRLGLALLASAVVLAFLFEARSINRLFPVPVFVALHSLGLGWSLVSITLFGAQLFDRYSGKLLRRWFPSTVEEEETVASPGRRKLLLAARSAIYATPAVALGYGTFIERQNFQVQEVTIPVAGLPKALNGLRIVQITDIHMGAFLSERDGERIVAMANETKAHLAIMTGDLVTRTGDPVDVCLRQLARVKADAGMIGCLGNHEIYAEVEDYVTAKGKRLGIEFLRSESKLMEFRGEKLNFAGVDYQRKGEKYLVGAERLIEPGVTNILLSHNPDVFPVAVRQGYALTLAGHTHGGQITVEYLQQFVNPARFATRYVSGLYTEADSRIYVSRGLGTVGVPTRICAPPELTVISLAAV